MRSQWAPPGSRFPLEHSWLHRGNRRASNCSASMAPPRWLPIGCATTVRAPRVASCRPTSVAGSHGAPPDLPSRIRPPSSMVSSLSSGAMVMLPPTRARRSMASTEPCTATRIPPACGETATTSDGSITMPCSPTCLSARQCSKRSSAMGWSSSRARQLSRVRSSDSRRPSTWRWSIHSWASSST